MSAEVEAAVLGLAFLFPASAEIALAELSPEDFELEAHRMIFGAMKDARRADVVLACNALRGRVPAETIVALSGTVANVDLFDEYVELLKAESARRQGLTESKEIAGELAGATAGNAPELIAAAADRFLGIAREAMPHRQVLIRDVAALVVKESETASIGGGGLTGLSCGIPELDRARGGLHAGDLGVIAARTSHGKTALALGIASHVARRARLPVLFVSTEMTVKALALRALCSLTGMDTIKVLQGQIDGGGVENLQTALEELSGVPLYLDDNAPAATVAYVHAAAVRIRQRHGGLGLVVVDYLQQLHAPGRFATRNDQVSHISRSLKALAMELQVPLLALSQLSRQADREKRRPVLSDLRDSGSIEQDSDFVLFIHRDADAGAGATDPVCELILAKNRGGPLSIWSMVFDRRSTRFLPAPARPSATVGPPRVMAVAAMRESTS